MKYYLINECQLETYISQTRYMLQLMEQRKIPYNGEVKEALKFVIQDLENQEPYKEADD